jgi:hypothetical protein
MHSIVLVSSSLRLVRELQAGKNLVLTSEMGGCAVYIAVDSTGANGPLFIHANANSVVRNALCV